jgi:hypothetical protein
MQGHVHARVRSENAGSRVSRKANIGVLHPLHDGGEGWNTETQIIKVTD